MVLSIGRKQWVCSFLPSKMSKGGKNQACSICDDDSGETFSNSFSFLARVATLIEYVDSITIIFRPVVPGVAVSSLFQINVGLFGFVNDF